MRCTALPPFLRSNRLHKVGIERSTIYVQPSMTRACEIWSLHTLYPSSWQCLSSIQMDEILYSIPAFSYSNPVIYELIIGVFKGEEYPRISLFEIQRSTGDKKEYRLDESSGPEFESVSLENAVLACGSTKLSSAPGLHLYDRSMVMGSIPYWNITLLEDTFIVSRDDVIDDSDEKCTRFPIAIDSGARIFARLTDEHKLRVSLGDEKGKWIEYILSPKSKVDLRQLVTRGLRETYGMAGHRMGAIESPLTIYSDGKITVAKVTRDKTHFYHRIVLDHASREFVCESNGAAKFEGGMDRMFYCMVTERLAAVLGIGAVAVVQLQPASLVELAVWSLQRQTSTKNGRGALSGGLSQEQISKKMCNFAHSKCLE